MAKKCDLVIVKIPDNSGVFIDALRLIIDDSGYEKATDGWEVGNNGYSIL